MMTIGIFQVGYCKANLNKLCKILSSPQSYYKFQVAHRLFNLGNPDLSGFAYSDNAFQSIINPYKNNFDVNVVITSVPIEDNFITRNIGYDLIIFTSHQTEELLEKSGRTPEECAAIGIAEELVSIEFQRVTGSHWTQLFHQDPRGCIFDFGGVKSQIVAKLISCKICIDCEGKLSNKNIHENIINYTKILLRRIKKPTLMKAFHMSINLPILSFIYGGLVIGTVVNVFSSLIINESPTYQQIVLLTILVITIPLFPISIYGWMWINHLKKK